MNFLFNIINLITIFTIQITNSQPDKEISSCSSQSSEETRERYQQRENNQITNSQHWRPWDNNENIVINQPDEEIPGCSYWTDEETRERYQQRENNQIINTNPWTWNNEDIFAELINKVLKEITYKEIKKQIQNYNLFTNEKIMIIENKNLKEMIKKEIIDYSAITQINSILPALHTKIIQQIIIFNSLEKDPEMQISIINYI